jgi:hypothetical protein
VAISRERAIDLSHRMVERLSKTAGVELAAEREQVRNQILKALLDWDRELEKVATEVTRKLSARGGRVVAGSREWDLLHAEELEKALGSLLARGE